MHDDQTTPPPKPKPLMIEGADLVLGGITYVLPSASLRTLKVYSKRLDDVSGQLANPKTLDMDMAADTIGGFLAQCLSRNYDGITMDYVLDNLSSSHLGSALRTALVQSGLWADTQPGGAAAADPQTPQTLGESTGSASPPTS